MSKNKQIKTIHFKNGMTKTVIKEISHIIKQRIEQGAAKFQTFNDQHGNLLLIINIEEIVYID
jgi:hypothetical protein